MARKLWPPDAWKQALDAGLAEMKRQASVPTGALCLDAVAEPGAEHAPEHAPEHASKAGDADGAEGGAAATSAESGGASCPE